jgi:hypothetical protein
MQGNVKVINGSTRILSIEEAAEKFRAFNLKVGRIETLTVPYELEFPFVAGASDASREHIVEVRGGYCDLLALQRETN